MNTVNLQNTRYGYKAEVGGAVWQLRQLSDGHTYSVYTTSDAEAYADLPHFYGDWLAAYEYLMSIARDAADHLS